MNLAVRHYINKQIKYYEKAIADLKIKYPQYLSYPTIFDFGDHKAIYDTLKTCEAQLEMFKTKLSYEITGTGDDGDEAYDDQNDNKTLVNSQGALEEGWDQCNVTSLSMTLINLANGDEAKVLKLTKALMKEHKIEVAAGWGLPEMLGMLIIKISPYKISSGMEPLKWAAELYPELVKNVEKITPIDAEKTLKEQVVTALKKNAEVIVGVYFGTMGHIVSLVAIASDGIVVNDPYGAWLGNSSYLKNGQEVSPITNTIKEILKVRFSKSGMLEVVLGQIEAKATNFRKNLGELNLWSWEEIKSKIGWILILGK